MALHRVSQRDLRSRSKEIMDAVEGGQAFTITREGRDIAELIPLRRRRRFVTRDDFAAASRQAPAVDLERFRGDQDTTYDVRLNDPYAR